MQRTVSQSACASLRKMLILLPNSKSKERIRRLKKIRELLKLARLAHTQTRDYSSALTAQEQFFQAAKHEILHAEKQAGVHSHIVARLFEQLPDLGATLAADYPKKPTSMIEKYERELMWRIVRLTDSILQLAVTGKGAAYDDTVLQQLENTLKLAKIVQQIGEE